MWLPVVTGGKVFILDLAAKIDQCAEYLCKQQWGDLEFPTPFGREAFPEVMLCIIMFLMKSYQSLCKRQRLSVYLQLSSVEGRSKQSIFSSHVS